MTTPARNEDAVLTRNIVQIDTLTNGTILTNWTTMRDRVVRQVRGESVSSPRRWDGTRAPLPWSNYGWVQHGAWRNIRFQSTNGTITVLPYGDQLLCSSPAVTQPTGDARTIRKATTDAILKAKDQQVNLSNVLAETRKTAELVSDTGFRIARSLQQFKRRYSRDWKKALASDARTIPARYLEWCYGWKPLFQDIEGSLAQIAETQYRDGAPHVIVHGKSGKIRLDDQLLDNVVAYGWRRVTKMKVVSSSRVTLKYGVASWLVQDAMALGLTNPFATAWESLPYSFVLDWLLPIGDYLNTFDVGPRCLFIEGSVSTITRGEMIEEITRVSDPSIRYTGFTTDAPARAKSWNFTRSLLTNFPVASFPDLKSPLSLDKMAKSLSLLTQVFRR